MKPNILFIVADDLNAWIGALGRHPDVKTPHIDALADRGTLFTRAYCSAPYCNASRMGFFTGLLPASTGVYQNEPLWESSQRPPTFVELLRASGYYTFGAGKVFHGIFDYATAGVTGASHAAWREIENRSFLWDDFRSNVAEPLPDGRPLNGLFDFADFGSVPPVYHHFDWGPLPAHRVTAMPDELVVDAVSDFLRAPPAEPFFAAAGLYKPHLPWHVPQQFFDLYDAQKLSLPLVKDDDLDDVPSIARTWALSPPDHELVTSRGQWRYAVQGYLASISYCDAMIGRLISALDESGAAETTAIVLCGDNGFHLGEKLHWRKFVLWEEATRVPLIVVEPGARSSHRRRHEPVSLIDIFPTMLEFAEQTPPDGDGESLLPLVRDPSRAREKPAIMTWQPGNTSVRTDAWRYTRYFDESEELYDHRTDPYEWTNLATIPAYDDVKASLRSII